MTPALVTAYVSQLRGLLIAWADGKMEQSYYFIQSRKLLDLADSALVKMTSADAAEPDLFGDGDTSSSTAECSAAKRRDEPMTPPSRKHALEAELREIKRFEKEDRAANPKVVGTPGEATERKRLTPAERNELMHRQGGLCGCGCTRAHFNESDPRIWWPMIDEHVLPLELGGSNDLSNRALYLVGCAKAKTREDIRRISKAKRQAKLMQPKEPSKRPLQSRNTFR